MFEDLEHIDPELLQDQIDELEHENLKLQNEVSDLEKAQDVLMGRFERLKYQEKMSDFFFDECQENIKEDELTKIVKEAQKKYEAYVKKTFAIDKKIAVKVTP